MNNETSEEFTKWTGENEQWKKLWILRRFSWKRHEIDVDTVWISHRPKDNKPHLFLSPIPHFENENAKKKHKSLLSLKLLGVFHRFVLSSHWLERFFGADCDVRFTVTGNRRRLCAIFWGRSLNSWIFNSVQRQQTASEDRTLILVSQEVF
jgi:hypothetical protein